MVALLERHGWVNIDKPVGLTSARVVGKVKRLLGVKKVGHTGTLDPFASGVLPLAIGEATKLSRFAMDGQKGYQFTLQWGASTDSGDTEGAVLEENPHIPELAEIQHILSQFTGEIEQTPPVYSAIKIDGKRAYARARAGEEVEMPSRKVQIYHLELLAHTGNQTQFYVECGKGTYIRSLGQDIAKILGGAGHLIQLRRTKVGRFSEKNTISLENLEELVYKERLSEILHPTQAVLDDIPVLSIGEGEALALQQGKHVARSTLDDAEEAAVLCDNVLISLVRIEDRVMKPTRVFNIVNYKE